MTSSDNECTTKGYNNITAFLGPEFLQEYSTNHVGVDEGTLATCDCLFKQSVTFSLMPY